MVSELGLLSLHSNFYFISGNNKISFQFIFVKATMHAHEFCIPVVIIKVHFIGLLLPLVFDCASVAIEDHAAMSCVNLTLLHLLLVTLVRK